MRKLKVLLLASFALVGCQAIDQSFDVVTDSQLREVSVWVASSSDEDNLSSKASVSDAWEVSWDANEQLGGWAIDSPTTEFAQFSATNQAGETLIKFTGSTAGDNLRLVYPYDSALESITSYGRYPISVKDQRVDLSEGNELNHLTESMCMMTEALEIDADGNVDQFSLHHVGAVFNINITAQNLADQTTIEIRSIELSEVPITGNLDLCTEGWDDPLPVDMYGTLIADVENAPLQGDGEEVTIPVAIFPFSMSAGQTLTAKINYTSGDKYYSATRTITASSDVSFARGKYHNINFVCDVTQAEETSLLGEGTIENPYQIWTVSDLEFLAASHSTISYFYTIYYKLMQDIDLGGSASNQWGGIGSEDSPFEDFFDGNGFCISGIYISNSSDNNGLFNYTNGARIHNLGVGGTISGAKYCGGVVGYTRGTIVTNCYNTCSITGTTGVGGIVGYYYTAGNSTKIINCYNSGKITSSATNNYVGGIAGLAAMATNCYNSGTISVGTANQYHSAIMYGTASRFDNCFYLSTCGVSEEYATSVTSTYLQSAEIVELLNARAASYNLENKGDEDYIEAAMWQQNSGGYPTFEGTVSQWLILDHWSGSGTEEDPYKINKKSDLEQLGYWNQQGETYDGYYFEVTAPINLEGSAENPWTPITGFLGNFDGGSHTISGLYVDSDEDYQGLFATIESSSKYSFDSALKNIYLEGEVRGGSYVGGVVGSSETYSDIYNCRFAGSVSGTNHVGGVAGYAKKRVDFCHSSGSIQGESYVGGTIGSTDDFVVNCYNSSSVTASGQNVGGVLGYASSTYDYVTNCLNCGSVSGGDDLVGGVVGRGSAIYSHNVGEVSGTGNFGPVVHDNGTYSNPYSAKGCCYSDTCGASSTSTTYTTVLTDEYMRSEAFVDRINACSKAYSDKISSYYSSSDDAGTTRLWETAISGYPRTIETEASGAIELAGEGTEENPYLVSSRADLENIKTLCSININFKGNYINLTQDIDLKCDADDQWSPIGISYTAPFSGNFNGCGHEISGIYIDSFTMSAIYLGLFGYVSNATITNLGVTNGYISNCYYVAMIAASGTSSTIANCYASGTISDSYVIAGITSISTSSIQTYNCYSSVEFINTQVEASGIASNDKYENCYYAESCGDTTGFDGAVSESYMQSEEMVEALNATAAELDETYDFGCLTWVYNQGGLPTLASE
ncbi:MAG: GLUG motif-containing protein [Rikenellaceae bacterium]